jgi:hypothetical protein
MKNTVRNTLLVTVATAALIAGAGLASAQGTGETREAPGATTQQPKAPGGKMDQQPNGAPQKAPAPMKPAPTAQAPAKETPAPTAQAPMKEKSVETAQAPAVAKSQAAEPGQAAQTSQSPSAHTPAGAANGETKPGAPAALSTEQHAKIRNTLRGDKAERLTGVHFAITVGEIVPGTVHLYRLPVSVLEYAPQYRDFEYILVGDEILIVDPRTMRIVAVISA